MEQNKYQIGAAVKKSFKEMTRQEITVADFGGDQLAFDNWKECVAVRDELAERAASSLDTSRMVRIDGSMTRDEALAAVRGEAVAQLVPKFAGQFNTHQEWVNKAASWLKSPDWNRPICVDSLGRRMAIGIDMAKARDEGTFPVRYFWECELAPVSARAADAPSEPSLKMLSGALNHARDTLRFYAEQEHFVRHQPDSWDTVSGEPQSLYEDASNTATVEDGTLAKNTLNDIAGVEAYASVATDALDSQPTVSAVLAELRADLRELANNTEAFGEYSQEAARVAFDSATAALDEVAAKYATSQPTDPTINYVRSEWESMCRKAVAVLNRHIVPDGISDHEALNELYGIFDSEEHRATGAIEQDACEARQAVQMGIDRTAAAMPERKEPHWIDGEQSALGGKTAREGYAANPGYAGLYASSQPTDGGVRNG